MCRKILSLLLVLTFSFSYCLPTYAMETKNELGTETEISTESDNVYNVSDDTTVSDTVSSEGSIDNMVSDGLTENEDVGGSTDEPVSDDLTENEDADSSTDATVSDAPSEVEGSADETESDPVDPGFTINPDLENNVATGGSDVDLIDPGFTMNPDLENGRDDGLVDPGFTMNPELENNVYEGGGNVGLPEQIPVLPLEYFTIEDVGVFTLESSGVGQSSGVYSCTNSTGVDLNLIGIKIISVNDWTIVGSEVDFYNAFEGCKEYRLTVDARVLSEGYTSVSYSVPDGSTVELPINLEMGPFRDGIKDGVFSFIVVYEGYRVVKSIEPILPPLEEIEGSINKPEETPVIDETVDSDKEVVEETPTEEETEGSTETPVVDDTEGSTEKPEEIPVVDDTESSTETPAVDESEGSTDTTEKNPVIDGSEGSTEKPEKNPVIDESEGSTDTTEKNPVIDESEGSTDKSEDTEGSTDLSLNTNENLDVSIIPETPIQEETIESSDILLEDMQDQNTSDLPETPVKEEESVDVVFDETSSNDTFDTNISQDIRE